MKPDVNQLIVHSVHKANILPLTSVCNVSCVFCSNPQNPPEVESYTIPPLSLDTVRQLLDFLDPDKKIIIGESATRICEGEPLTHPHFKEVIPLIRRKFPSTSIQVTTNGIGLTQEVAEVLAAAGNVELNVSVNSIESPVRQLIMKDTSGPLVLKNVKQAKRLGLGFHGSIVAMPHITGWDDLDYTLNSLDELEAVTTRVFVSGYTRYAKVANIFDRNVEERLYHHIAAWRTKTKMPLSCEPTELQDIDAAVIGVFPSSPACRAGIRLGDVIKSINQNRVFSRVDAFRRLQDLKGQAAITLERQNREIEVFYEKQQMESPGILMDYDIDPDLVKRVTRIIEEKNYQDVLLLTSDLGGGVLRAALAKSPLKAQLRINKVPNLYFGGNIRAAGLLVVRDFTEVLQKELSFGKKFDAVIIPSTPFDHWGRDLLGQHYNNLGQGFSINLEIV